MAVESCNRCGRLVDLDWHVDDIEYINDEPVCDGCWTEEEEKEIYQEAGDLQ